jgi:hypothetical protein
MDLSQLLGLRLIRITKKLQLFNQEGNKMYTDNKLPGVEVEVVVVKHLPKCARCFKHGENFGNDPVFAGTCTRCASEMHTLFYDVNFGNHNFLPATLTRDIDEFIAMFVRPNLRHLTWQEINKKFADK